MKKLVTLYSIVVLIFIALVAFFLVPNRTHPEEYSSSSQSTEAVPASSVPKPATILFVGDMMFDRYIRQVAERNGGDYIFSCEGVGSLLQSVDLVVGNLEGPVTKNDSKSVGTKEGDAGHFTFTFPTSTATLLFRHNIRMVNLGNNHMLNFSRDGLLETKRWLDADGVKYFGDPDSPEELRVATTTLSGVPIAFVNWSDWTSDKTDHTIAQVRKEKAKGQMVFVYTHWGDEYVPPPERVKILARSFIDAGAEMVVGSHPHIVQESETYKGKKIYYSLGNFIFDQYFEENVRNGLALRVAITPDAKTSVEEIPVRLEREGRTCLKK